MTRTESTGPESYSTFWDQAPEAVEAESIDLDITDPYAEFLGASEDSGVGLKTEPKDAE